MRWGRRRTSPGAAHVNEHHCLPPGLRATGGDAMLWFVVSHFSAVGMLGELLTTNDGFRARCRRFGLSLLKSAPCYNSVSFQSVGDNNDELTTNDGRVGGIFGALVPGGH